MGFRVDLLPTTGPNTAGGVAVAAVAAGAKWIVAAGGDGTINEVAGGLAHSHIPLGILPAGTANVLAAELGLQNNLAAAALQICNATPHRVALGSATTSTQSRYFLTMAGVGLDAAIIYELDLALKRKLGKLAYWHGGLRQLGRRVARFHVSVNGHEHRASFVLISRVRNYGGDFEIARQVRLTDDDFEIIVFQNDHWFGYLRLFLSIVRNRLDHARDVTIYRGTEAHLSAPEDARIYVQTDGEGIGSLPCDVRIVPNALTLLLPDSYIRRHSLR